MHFNLIFAVLIQVENPIFVSLATTLEIPFSYLFAYLFSGEVPNQLSGIGAGIIFLVVVGTGIKVSHVSHGYPICKSRFS